MRGTRRAALDVAQENGSIIELGYSSLEPGYEREPLPEEPGGEERVLRLVEEAFDRKRRAA